VRRFHLQPSVVFTLNVSFFFYLKIGSPSKVKGACHHFFSLKVIFEAAFNNTPESSGKWKVLVCAI
jgi:hypothetical protein